MRDFKIGFLIFLLGSAVHAETVFGIHVILDKTEAISSGDSASRTEGAVKEFVVGIEQPDGTIVNRTILATARPAFTFSTSELDVVEIIEIRDLRLQIETRWEATARLNDAALQRFLIFRQYRLFDRLLLTIDGKAQQELPVPVLAMFPIGGFWSKGEMSEFSERFAEQHGVRFQWIPFDEEAFHEIQERVLNPDPGLGAD